MGKSTGSKTQQGQQGGVFGGLMGDKSNLPARSSGVQGLDFAALANRQQYNRVTEKFAPADAEGNIVIASAAETGAEAEAYWDFEPGETLSGWIVGGFLIPEAGRIPRVVYKLERAPYKELMQESDPETGELKHDKDGNPVMREVLVEKEVVLFSERFKLKDLKELPMGAFVEITRQHMVQNGSRDTIMFDVEAKAKLSRCDLKRDMPLYVKLNADWRRLQAPDGGPYG